MGSYRTTIGENMDMLSQIKDQIRELESLFNQKNEQIDLLLKLIAEATEHIKELKGLK